MIRRIVQADGLPLKGNTPRAHEVISVETARTMMTFLKAVPQYGTAARAGAELKHPLGGKTGTTNNFTDAWFIGFSPSVTCGTWIGFDNRQSLGDKEQGARAALPAWITFMKAAIARTPNEQFPNGAVKKLQVATDEAAPEKAAPKPKPDDMADDADDADDSAGKKPASSDVVPDTVPQAIPEAAPDDSGAPVPAPAPSSAPTSSAPPAAPAPRAGAAATPRSAAPQ